MLLSLVVGSRANLVKAAPVMAHVALRQPLWNIRLLHTGMPDDHAVLPRLLTQLEVREPDVHLGIRTTGFSCNIALATPALQQVFDADRPDVVMVFGDVCATLAGTLAAGHFDIPVAHVEAGLRSFDRRASDEKTRVLTDAASEWLFTSERGAEDNLRREGIPEDRIHFVGNTQIDSLNRHRPAASELHVASLMGVSRPFALVTIDKRENVASEPQLREIVSALVTLADEFDVVFPAHPRTQQRLREYRLWQDVRDHPRLRLLGAVGYHEFLSLLHDCSAVLTDSGGVQEEALVVGAPCATLRERTAHAATLQHRANRLAGSDPHLAVRYVAEAIRNRDGYAPYPEGWDGHAALRIVDVLARTTRGRTSGADGPVLTPGSADQVLPGGSDVHVLTMGSAGQVLTDGSDDQD